MSFSWYNSLRTTDHLTFEFVSIGPKGAVKKFVQYKKLDPPWIETYNLGFGDIDESSGNLNDLIVTDNGDRDVVLSTVAMSLLDFLAYRPHAQVFVTGSTEARTRLYVAQVSKNWNQVNARVTLQGLLPKGEWEPFEIDGRYQAILIRLKKS